eukprot:snap_masked-scaffold_1-processed-gene-18.21-mRNA-1 protein AED:1.00 eAED:1.00 QI:0/0/0/0/1/1/2/0/191
MEDQKRSHSLKQSIKTAVKEFQEIRTEEDCEYTGHWIRRSARQPKATKFFAPDEEYSKTKIYFTAVATSKYSILNKYFCLATKIAKNKVPKNIFEAQRMPEAANWLKAYNTEYEKFLSIAGCERISRSQVPVGAKVYRYVEILSAKEDNITKQRKYKAIFAANGKGSIVHGSIYSPAASKKDICIFLFRCG